MSGTFLLPTSPARFFLDSVIHRYVVGLGACGRLESSVSVREYVHSGGLTGSYQHENDSVYGYTSFELDCSIACSWEEVDDSLLLA